MIIRLIIGIYIIGVFACVLDMAKDLNEKSNGDLGLGFSIL